MTHQNQTLCRFCGTLCHAQCADAVGAAWDLATGYVLEPDSYVHAQPRSPAHDALVAGGLADLQNARDIAKRGPQGHAIAANYASRARRYLVKAQEPDLVRQVDDFVAWLYRVSNGRTPPSPSQQAAAPWIINHYTPAKIALLVTACLALLLGTLLHPIPGMVVAGLVLAWGEHQETVRKRIAEHRGWQ